MVRSVTRFRSLHIQRQNKLSSLVHCPLELLGNRDPLLCVCVVVTCFQTSRRQRRGRAPTSTAGTVRRVWSTPADQGASATRRRSPASTSTRPAAARRRAALTGRLTVRRANSDCLLAGCRPTSKSRTKDRAPVSYHL